MFSSKVLWVALASVTLFAAPASAQVVTTPCTFSDVKFMGSNASDCDGLFSGNDVPTNEDGIDEYLNSQFSGDWYVVGKSDNPAGTNPFTNLVGIGGSSGSFSLADDITGAFGISVKFGNNYGAYFFNTALEGKNFTFTSPVARGGGLSHATLWKVRECTIDCDPNTGIVPEPSSFALMMGGLLSLGVVARRRRKV